MNAVLAALLLGTATLSLRASEVPELDSLKARYSHTDFALDEAARANYVLRLARLRFELIMAGDPGWQEVDREIIRHPAPGKSNSETLAKLRLGPWHSSRHDYRYEINGTWRMTDDAETTTHGTWSIQGAQYSETFAGADGASASTYTIILADNQNFIFTDGTHLFFEKRTLGVGLPIRQEEQGQ